MADLFIILIGLALFATGTLGVLRPGTGTKPDRVMRTLQIITGLIMIAVGLAFAIAGLTGHKPS